MFDEEYSFRILFLSEEVLCDNWLIFIVIDKIYTYVYIFKN